MTAFRRRGTVGLSVAAPGAVNAVDAPKILCAVADLSVVKPLECPEVSPPALGT